MSSSLRERALRLLARREHARVELRRKLAPHAESAEELDHLLDDLTARRLLSDERYAEMRMHTRAPRYGNAKLAYELRQQGVADDLVEAAIADSGDEVERARLVWQRKFPAAPVDAIERGKQSRFLQSRGFSMTTIIKVLKGGYDDE